MSEIEARRNTSRQTDGEDTVQDALAVTLADTYRAQYQLLESNCSGKSKERSSIYSTLMSLLSKRWSPVLKISASEKCESIAPTYISA
jgi:hypothetical protein